MGLDRRIGTSKNIKGENVGLNALHKWLKKRIVKLEKCYSCSETKTLDLANISHTYNPETYTKDIENWLWLCRSCHMKTDGRSARLFSASQKAEIKDCLNCGKSFYSTFIIQKHCQKKCALSYATKKYENKKRLSMLFDKSQTE